MDIKEIKLKDVRSDDNLWEAFQKLRHRETLDQWQDEAIVRFTDMFCTCTLCPAMASEKAVEIAEKVNWHGHSNSCKKAGPGCRFLFPRFPLAATIFIDITKETPEAEKMEDEQIFWILKRVTHVLVEEVDGKMNISPKVKEIMDNFNKKNETNPQ